MEAEARQKISHKRNFLIKKIEQLETEIENLEAEKKQIESNLAKQDFYKDQIKVADAGKRYQVLRELIPKRLDEWETNQAELEELLSGLDRH